MPDIFHNFPIKGSANKVFEAITTAEGLNSWWSESCQATPGHHAIYNFGFGPGYEWSAISSRYEPGHEFELRFTNADADWLNTRVGFRLNESDGVTEVRFHHLGWPQQNDHYEISCFCWAMYLRHLKLFVENGAVVPYKIRLDV